MKKICIVTNLIKDPDRVYESELSQLLNNAGITNYTIQLKGNDRGLERIDPEMIQNDTDCIMVLGGDGTLLEAARDLMGKMIPLLGINIGHLGFLTDIEGTNLKYAVDKIRNKEYFLEKRMMIKGVITRNGVDIYRNIAFNDIVFSRNGRNQITTMEFYVNSNLLNVYEADGLIVSTPTGSTAYNHSAGGPVVEPTASMFVVTPICSQILGIPSILLDGSDILEVVMPRQNRHPNQKVGVSFDGEDLFELEPDDRITITKSNYPVELVRLSRASFLETLRKKINQV